MLRALAIALVPYLLLVRRFWFTCDDAYITFRYAKHFDTGTGLIFNPGESPPVEGYSNLLWALLLTYDYGLRSIMVLQANVESAFCGIVLIGLVAGFVRRRLDLCALGTAATALVLATLPPMVIWATSGLETMPFALAVFATFYALAAVPQRPHWAWAAAAAGVAVLLRADGFVWIGIVLAAAVVGGGVEVRRGVARTSAAVALVVVSHFLWRHSYYGEWLPNTARVKAGFSLVRVERGWNYLASLILAVPALAVITLASGAVRGGLRGRVVVQSMFVGFTGAAYVVFVGGDFMAMGRFLVPAMPFLVLAFAAAWSTWSLPARLSLAGIVVALNLLGCFDLLPVPQGLRQYFHFRWNTEEARSEVEQWAYMKRNGEELAALGLALEQYTEPGESMIRSSVGGPGYFTELVLLDRNGLVSPEVLAGSEPLERASPGHDRRVEPSFFFDQRPTYYGAKLIESGGGPSLGREARQLIAEGRLEVLRHPLEDGIELQLLRFRWIPR